MTQAPARNAAFELVMPDGRARGILFAICVVVPMLITMVALVLARAPHPSLEGAPDASAMFPVMPIAWVLLVVVSTWVMIDRLMQRHRLRLDRSRIDIVTSFYRRSLALDELRVKEARVVDLDEHTGLRPGMKTNAMATPGFRSGWFRLRNRERAFVAMASGPRVLWIPTSAGFGLMLEVAQPQALLAWLRDATDSSGRAR